MQCEKRFGAAFGVASRGTGLVTLSVQKHASQFDGQHQKQNVQNQNGDNVHGTGDRRCSPKSCSSVEPAFGSTGIGAIANLFARARCAHTSAKEVHG